MMRHVPVLLDETLAALHLGEGDVFVDATFGAGGYTRAALAHGVARAFAIDRDSGALAASDIDDPRLTLIEGRFSALDALVRAHGTETVDAIAMDIGVSSMQLDQPERGFSFAADGPLDMRMGSDGPTAADIVNDTPEGELADILFRYGDERQSRRIARALVADRPFHRTAQLAAVVRSVLGQGVPGKDPATRTFQALRIAVNDELGELTAGLDAAERLLAAGGRLAVVSFHSAEDRLVKAFFRDRGGAAPAASRHAPPRAARTPTFTRTTRAVRPSAAEIDRNPRARSATLRAATRTSAPVWGTA